jgi:hypothetical protein
VSYSIEWIPGAAVVGIVALFWVPSVALIALFVILLAAVAVVVALAGAVVAAPYLLGRSIRGRLRARRGADLDSAQLTALAALPRHPAGQSGGAT